MNLSKQEKRFLNVLKWGMQLDEWGGLHCPNGKDGWKGCEGCEVEKRLRSLRRSNVNLTICGDYLHFRLDWSSVHKGAQELIRKHPALVHMFDLIKR